MKKRRHRYYQMAGPVKYQMTGARQDNTTVNRVLPLEMEMANTANSRDEFGRTYPTQQNRGTISAPVSLDPNSGFTRNAGESAAMSRYKEDVFKREMQGGFAGAGLGAASHYAGRGLRALRGANKMRPSGPPNIMQEFDVPRAARTKPGPAQVKPEDDTFKMAAEIFNAGPGSPGYSSLSRGQMTASEFEKALPNAIERMKAKKFLEEALKKKFRYGGAAHRYMRY
jgi:hypothetical protein